ncbi:hypothetical protein Trco_007653 [Trichoderma cornu-damae]|uniref:Uncharacterized protein n=1 Tax=Trichoderma cornu-damae TaxID=654480 RepID=A0A9P8TTM1_9HYPO|nr:hypothetical protein Trco_007653 [Trichoderma cornu-damae]
MRRAPCQSRHLKRHSLCGAAKLGRNRRRQLSLEPAGYEPSPRIHVFATPDGDVDIDGRAERRDVAPVVNPERRDLAGLA